MAISPEKSSTYEDLLARHTRLLPARPDLAFIGIARCRIDMAISQAKSDVDSVLDLVRLQELSSY